MVFYSDGFAACNDILRNRRFQQQFGNRTMKDLRRVTYNADKRRFDLKQFPNGSWKMRATGKHSVKVRVRYFELESWRFNTSVPATHIVTIYHLFFNTTF